MEVPTIQIPQLAPMTENASERLVPRYANTYGLMFKKISFYIIFF